VKIHEQVREMFPPRYTVSQAASLVGKDVDTLKRWKRQGIFAPSDSRSFGKLDVDLYTSEDIQAMKKIARELRPGRKKSA
jgi:DNA-binding transcriptional MerR regulator